MKNKNFNKKAFADYMSVYAVSHIRVQVFVLVLVGADMFLLFPTFAIPSRLLHVFIVPPVVFLNLWAIWIMINPQKRQLQYTLFRGVYGIICSVGLLIITQKFAYETLQLQTPIYFILLVGLYVFALGQFYKNHINKLQKPIKKTKWSKETKIAAYTVVLGHLIAIIILIIVTKQVGVIVFLCSCITFYFALFYMMMELHRYYYLRKYIEGGGKTDTIF